MNKKKKIQLKENTLEIVFTAVFAILTVIFLIQLFLMDKLPMKYFAVIAVILLALPTMLGFVQMAKKISKNNKTLGKVIMGILSVFLLIGNLYLYQTNNAIRKIVSNKTNEISISVIVMNDSSVQSIEELSGTLGNINVGDYSYIEKATDEIFKVNSTINIKDYIGFDTFGNALYNHEIEAIILNESLRGQFEETHPNFSEETRVIKTYSYEEESQDFSVNVDVTQEPFTIYLTGIDQQGSISVQGRSDVNKLLTVNPKTRQIFILDIPRDYYIPQVCQAYQKDKLTHTGLFGADCTVKSFADYLGIDINYYARVNFSSLKKIVDALGGIEVESAYDFSIGSYSFTKGINYLNGSEALAFSRERHSFADGDNVRIQNQSRVLKGIINKVTSPAILTNYLSFMDAIGGTFQTNMDEKEINALIKMQINDMRGWTITEDALTGIGATEWSPANGFNSYVMIPNEESVSIALGKIREIMNAE